MSKPWFKAKRYGYGAGLPCSWEGWLALAGLFAGLYLTHRAAFTWLDKDTAATAWFVASAVLIVAFGAIARAKTEGGWKWRGGGD